MNIFRDDEGRFALVKGDVDSIQVSLLNVFLLVVTMVTMDVWEESNSEVQSHTHCPPAHCVFSGLFISQ